MGKNFDNSGSVGPWMVTADELPDPGSLDLSLTLNGETKQSSNTRFRDADLCVKYLSPLVFQLSLQAH